MRGYDQDLHHDKWHDSCVTSHKAASHLLLIHYEVCFLMLLPSLKYIVSISQIEIIVNFDRIGLSKRSL